MKYEKLKVETFSDIEAFCATGSAAGAPAVSCSSGTSIVGANCVATGASADESITCTSGTGTTTYNECINGSIIFSQCTSGSGD